MVARDRRRALDSFTPGDDHRPLRVDAPPGPAHRDARALRSRPRRPRGALDRRRRACSSRPSPSTPATTPCACCAAPSPRGIASRRPPAPLDRLIYSEISRRRATGERGEDVLSLLLDAQRRGRRNHAHRPADPRRGHDAAVRRPRHDHLDDRVHVLRARPPSRRSSRACSPSRTPSSTARLPTRRAADRRRAALAGAWCSTRRCACTRPPGSARAAPSSRFRVRTATRSPAAPSSTTARGPRHHLPDVFAEPDAFRPERFAPEAKAALPQGRLRPLRRRLAHVHRHALRPARGPHDRHAHPLALRALAARTTSSLTIRQMPTISPSEGLPMIVCLANRQRLPPLSRMSVESADFS